MTAKPSDLAGFVVAYVCLNKSALTNVNGPLPVNLSLKITVYTHITLENKFTDKLSTLA